MFIDCLGVKHGITELLYEYHAAIPPSLADFPSKNPVFESSNNDPNHPPALSNVFGKSFKKGENCTMSWTVDVEKSPKFMARFVEPLPNVVQPQFGALGGLPRISGLNTPQIFVKQPGSM